MPEIVRINITNFRFAIGGEHYYGSLRVAPKLTRTPEGGVTWNSNTQAHPLDGEVVTRVLSDEVEIAYLREKDDDDTWEAGMATERFVSKEDVIAAAKLMFTEHFDPDDLLCITKSKRHTDFSGEYWEDYDYAVAGPEGFVDVINSLSAGRDRVALLAAHGYPAY